MSRKPEQDIELIDRLKKQRAAAYEATKKYRDEARTLKEYFKGNQLPEEVLDVLTSRQQPVEWENIHKKIGNKIAGLMSLTKKEVNAFAVQTEDKPVSYVLTSLLRVNQESDVHIEEKEKANFDLINTGIGIMKPVVKSLEGRDLLGKREKEIVHYHCAMEHSYWDPFYRKADGSDMRYFHETRLMAKDELYGFFDEELVDRLDNREFYGSKSSEDVPGDEMVVVSQSFYKVLNKESKKMEVRFAVWGEEILLYDEPLKYNIKKIPVSIRRVYPIDPENPEEFYSPTLIFLIKSRFFIYRNGNIFVTIF